MSNGSMRSTIHRGTCYRSQLGMDRTLPVAHRFSTVALLTLASLGVAMALALSLFGVEGKTHALAQLSLFPLIVFLASRVELVGVVVPRWALAFALTGALASAIFTYTHVDLARGAFVVAPLEDDQADNDTKIRRDRIRRSLGAAGLALVGTHTSTVTSQSEAEKILQNNPTLGGVVWGSMRWMTVSLRAHEPMSMSSLPAESLGRRFLREFRYEDLRIATGIHSFGISDGLDPTTLLFIGRLVPVWRDFPRELSGPHDDGALFEQNVRSMAALKARWTSFSHRALPMWMTGTYHLVRAISSDELERSELSCAINSFEAARSQLRSSDNPELQVAISNNLAIALLIQGAVEYEMRDKRKVAVKLLKSSLRHAKAVSQYSEVRALISFNLSTLKGKHGKRQRRKKDT